jgi:hypothetical protein
LLTFARETAINFRLYPISLVIVGFNPLLLRGSDHGDFPSRERFKLQLRSEFFSALNTPYFGAPNGISFTSNDSIQPDGARMGEVRGLRQPMRIIQFGLKLSF